MTVRELRERLGAGDSSRFTLATHELKNRLGEPIDIRILSGWCKTTGRDVVLMVYPTDDGKVEVFCPIGFLNGEETVLDGWIGSVHRDEVSQDASSPAPPGIENLMTLFDQVRATPPVVADNEQPPSWRQAEQATFEDLLDEESVDRASASIPTPEADSTESPSPHSHPGQ